MSDQLEPEAAEQRDFLHRLVAYRRQVIHEIAAALTAADHPEAAAAVLTMADPQPTAQTIHLDYVGGAPDQFMSWLKRDIRRHRPEDGA